MQFALSTYLTAGSRLTAGWLERARQAGFARVELFAGRLSLDYRDRGQVEELGHWFRDSPLKPHALHMPPAANIAETDRIRRRAECDELKRALEVLELVSCPLVIQHFGARDDLFHERRVDAAFASLEELNLFARDRGAAILLENGTSELAQPARILRFLEATHLPNHVLFDIGHAHLGDGVEAGFRALEPRIKAVHVHDNDGRFDQHLLPQRGSIDWRAAMRLLRRGHDNGELVLTGSVKDTGEWENPAMMVHDALSRLKDIRIRNEDEEE